MARKRKPNAVSPLRHVSAEVMADTLGVSDTALRGYAIRGCPRNGDGSYDTALVVEWMEEQARGNSEPSSSGVLEDLQAKRIERQIALSDIVISSKRGETISMADHDAVLGAQASEMRAFLTGSFPANAEHFVGRSVEDIRALLLELARQAVEVWINAPAKKLHT